MPTTQAVRQILPFGIRIAKEKSAHAFSNRMDEVLIPGKPMLVISKFYGIVIRMMFLRHFGACFHACYGVSELVVSIDPIRIIQGNAPRRACAMVLEWANWKQTELIESWHRLSAAQKPVAIAPLI